MTHHNIIPFHVHYLDAAAHLYQQAYAVPAAEDAVISPLEMSREVIVGHWQRPDFAGVLAVDAAQSVNGFAWGYRAMQDNSRLTQLVVKKLGPEWVENTFVLEAFAVAYDALQQGLEAQLYEKLLQQIHEAGYDRVRMRLELARMDSLADVLEAEGWDELQRLSHVVWVGKNLQ